MIQKFRARVPTMAIQVDGTIENAKEIVRWAYDCGLPVCPITHGPRGLIVCEEHGDQRDYVLAAVGRWVVQLHERYLGSPNFIVLTDQEFTKLYEKIQS